MLRFVGEFVVKLLNSCAKPIGLRILLVLSAGLARRHRGNPAAAVRVHSLYCTPVLFSGLASLVLNNAETKVIDSHYQNTLQNLQRLHQKTPRSVILFLAGSLPGEAILHIRQLTLFAMICHQPDDHLYSHAKYVLTSSSISAKSWFQQIRDLCLKYSLPHPLHLLENPPSRSVLKSRVKSSVTDYWEKLLTAEATELKSLSYLKPSQYNLKQPSLLWQAACGNSFECAKSLIIAKMISGRYRSEDLCKHWSSSNKLGLCLAPTCSGVAGDLEHILVVCPALQEVRGRLTKLWLDRSTQSPALFQLLKMVLASPPQIQVQFILDPTVFDGIKMLMELHGLPIIEYVLYLTQTYAYYIHREKMIMPGDHGRRQKTIMPAEPKPLHALLHSKIYTHNTITNAFLVPGNFATCSDQPSTVPCHSSLTTLSTASHTHTHTIIMPGLATCVGSQQHTAGHSDVPHTAGHTAHHGVGGRGWGWDSGGSDVPAVVGLSSHHYYSSSQHVHLSFSAGSVSTTSEEGGLMLV